MFKAQALEVMRSVEETGENVVITAHGKRTLVLTPLQRHISVTSEKLKALLCNLKIHMSRFLRMTGSCHK